MIIYRLYFENVGLTEKWWNDFSSLTDEEKMVINPIIEKNDFKSVDDLNESETVHGVLKYYCISRKDAENTMF